MAHLNAAHKDGTEADARRDEKTIKIHVVLNVPLRRKTGK